MRHTKPFRSTFSSVAILFFFIAVQPLMQNDIANLAETPHIYQNVHKIDHFTIKKSIFVLKNKKTTQNNPQNDKKYVTLHRKNEITNNNNRTTWKKFV